MDSDLVCVYARNSFPAQLLQFIWSTQHLIPEEVTESCF